MGASITDYLALQKPASTTVDSSAVVGGSKTAAGKASLATSYQTFLVLLTSQLKNQDPLKPMDTDSFTQQLVSMTGVEQQLLSNDLLQSLVNQSTSGSNLNALSLIGKTITAETSGGNLKDGAVAWDYELAKTATSATIQIQDAKGKTVWSGPAPSLDEGKHAFSWNGKTTDGAQLADGLYTITLTAKDAEGALVSSATYFTGRATALEHEDGGTQVRIGAVTADLNGILSVSDSTAT